MNAKEFAADYLRRYPNLRHCCPKRILDKDYSPHGSQPDASQVIEEIWLHPKFWLLSDKDRDFVFTHEIGHYLLRLRGTAGLIRDLNELGIDPWTLPLPFGAVNMDEAFADCFATYIFAPNELRQYPAWFEIMRRVFVKKGNVHK
jgi:hypothetical protein